MKSKKHEQWRKGFPYYKVQYWDSRSVVWREVQKHFKTEGEARKYGINLDTRYRIVKLDRDRRQIV